MTNTNSDAKTARKPSHTAYSIREREGKEAKWTEIGVAFRNKDGGFTVLFEAVPLTGKIVLRAPESKE